MEPVDSLSTAWIAWTLKLNTLETDIEQYVFNDRFKQLSLESGKVSSKDDRYALLHNKIQTLIYLKNDISVSVKGKIK